MTTIDLASWATWALLVFMLLILGFTYCVGAAVGYARGNRDRVNAPRRAEIARLEAMYRDAP